MSDNKKYYYLKLKDNFFDTDEMIVLESMKDGMMYSNILLKLYLRSLKFGGKLMLNERIPYNPEMLASITRHPVSVVKESVRVFKELGLIEVLDNGAVYMLDIQNFIGKSSSESDRIRLYRKRIAEEKKLSSTESRTNVTTNVQQMYDKNTPEIDIDIELDIDKDIELEKENNHHYHDDYKRKSEKNNDDDKMNAEIFLLWEKNIMPLTPIVAEKLNALVEETGEAFVSDAICKAVEYGKRNFAYIQAVARNLAAGNGEKAKSGSDPFESVFGGD